MEKITITRALIELKMLDKRLSRDIKESVFLGFTTGNKVMGGYESNQEFEKEAKECFQKCDLCHIRVTLRK